MRIRVKDVLAEIKKSIEREDISWGELAFLHAHPRAVLQTGDIELAEWACIEEEDYNKYMRRRKHA